jgi:hypothetical protein
MKAEARYQEFLVEDEEGDQDTKESKTRGEMQWSVWVCVKERKRERAGESGREEGKREREKARKGEKKGGGGWGKEGQREGVKGMGKQRARASRARARDDGAENATFSNW